MASDDRTWRHRRNDHGGVGPERAGALGLRRPDQPPGLRLGAPCLGTTWAPRGGLRGRGHGKRAHRPGSPGPGSDGCQPPVAARPPRPRAVLARRRRGPAGPGCVRDPAEGRRRAQPETRRPGGPRRRGDPLRPPGPPLLRSAPLPGPALLPSCRHRRRAHGQPPSRRSPAWPSSACPSPQSPCTSAPTSTPARTP